MKFLESGFEFFHFFSERNLLECMSMFWASR